jgi:hypothetical protein
MRDEVDVRELPKSSSARTLTLAPHVLLFLFYNLLYFVPLFSVFVWGYSGGGAADSVAMDAATMGKVSVIYAAGIIAFLLGALAVKLIRRTSPHFWCPIVLNIKLSDKLLIAGLIGVFLVSKVALIPDGVYHSYAFSTGEMSGGMWSFSTVCSEALVLAAMMALLSSYKHNVIAFVLLSLLNAINLLHGTRIFFIIAATTGLFYARMSGYLTAKRLTVYGPFAAGAVLVLAYFVFLWRSRETLDGALTIAKLVSPIVYESLFSQLSLVNLIRSPALWTITGHANFLWSDAIVSSIPRILLPDKDSLTYFNQFAQISPLGAMSGYAAGMIYFGIFFPLFYIAAGFVAAWLRYKAEEGPWWLLMYGYFCADFLFRIMRDGYLIPLKMLLNTLEIVAIFIVFRIFFRLLKRTRRHAAVVGIARVGGAE